MQPESKANLQAKTAAAFALGEVSTSLLYGCIDYILSILAGNGY